jgi:hypothetical protein
VQALACFADEQWPMRGTRHPEPSAVLVSAAGLHGEQGAEQQFHSIQLAIQHKLVDSGVTPTSCQTLMTCCEAVNVRATAQAVLRMPELLYLPLAVRQRVMRHPSNASCADIDALLWQSCLVLSPTLSVNFCDPWQNSECKPQQVRSLQ